MTDSLHGIFKNEPPPAGLIEHYAREAFADLCRLYGFERAREIMAEIINSEAGDRNGRKKA